MKIQLLREFLILGEALNFTKAAQRLCITQPVLSRHIKELEEYLGAELVYRDTHNVKLTSAGALLLEECRKIINQYESSIALLHQFTGQSKQKLSIAYLGEAYRHILGNVMDNFYKDNQSVSVNFRDCELDEAINYIRQGEYDIGFILRPNLTDKFSHFNHLPFITDPLCIAMNRDHPLANNQIVSLREVVNYPIIREDPREFSLSEYCSTDFLKKHNLEFTIQKEYPNLRTCLFNLEINKEAVFLIPRHRLY